MKQDLTGLRFGRWTVIARSDERKYKHHIAYVCRCDCGTVRSVVGSGLRRGESTSCGCLFRERAAQSQKTHGLTKHRLAGIWRSMKERCNNPNHVAYHRYGGRGIEVCARWTDLAAFVDDNDHLALPGLSLDRIDNDGPYSPENCHWTTSAEQCRNRSNNVLIEHNGERLLASEWARRVGVTPEAITARLKAGWTVEDAVTLPPVSPKQRRSFPNQRER